MENINICPPSACYTVEKILEISPGQGSHRNYKVQWAPSWVNELHLMGCEALINQFLNQKNHDTTSSQNTTEDVKLEDDGSINQTEVESASDNIDISSQQGIDNEDVTQPVSGEKNVLCDTIKIEEDDSSTESTSNQDLTVHQDTTRESIELSNDAHENENYHFDRCIGDLPINISLASNSANWNNTCHDSRKQLNQDVSPYLNYSENMDKQNIMSTTKQRKHTMKHNVNSTCTNVSYTSRLQKEKTYIDKVVNPNYSKNNNQIDLANHPRSILHSNIESNVKQSQDYISTVLQHPSKHLSNTSNADVSLQHRKHTFIDTNSENSSSTYTKFPKTFVVGSDEDNPVNNETIDTTGYKSATAYTNYPVSSLESNDTGQGSENTNSNERDNNRHSDISDGVNILSSFETPVVNQYEDKSGDAGTLQHSNTTSNCEAWSTMGDSSSLRHQPITSMNTGFDQCSINFNAFNGPLNLQQYMKSYEMPSFRNMREMVAEKRVKTSYICKTCNATFTLKKLYTKHLKTHIAKKTFICDVCLKEFLVKDHWRRHIRMHTDERPYPCEFCGRRFRDISNLKIHVRRAHTMERPHKCNMCIKQFATTSDLKKHIRIHTGERPYICTLCNFRFKTSSQLRGHARRCNSRI